MKKSELEKDVEVLIEAVRASDYEMPSNSDVMKIIFRKLRVVILIQAMLLLIDFLLYGNEWGGFAGKLLISSVGVLVFMFAFSITLYQPVSMILSIDSEVKKGSLVINLLMDKLNRYWRALVSVNLFVGAFLLICEDGFVSGLGISWLVTFIIASILFQVSLSRYMTPVVVSSLSKVKELLSASPK